MNAPPSKNPAAGTNGARQQSSTSNRQDSRSSLIAAMGDTGVPPAYPGEIVLDGTLRRYKVEGDKPGRRNGWYRAFNDDRPAGAFGSWRTGVASTWSLQGVQKMSAADREAMHRRAAEDCSRRAAEIATRQNEARGHATAHWINAEKASCNHPYLTRKRIRTHGAKQSAGRLILPLIDFNGSIWSLQYIAGDGTKRMLKGGRKAGRMIHIGGLLYHSTRVLIAEGWATGCTLAEAEPESLVLAAIDAGNLHAVTVGARCLLPKAEIVVCADNDDVGVAKGRAAAIAAGALLAVPEFPPRAEGSDFNDLAVLQAKEVV